jgi:acyl-CoA thioester hydrolase
MTEKTAETRANYPHVLAIATRWMDNDIYGHVNNVVYYSYFDTVINEYLIRAGGLDIQDGAVIGVCAESHCNFRDSFTFPESHFVHVFVERATMTPVAIPEGIRAALEQLVPGSA